MTAAELTTLSPAKLDKMSKAELITEILDGVTRIDSRVIEEDANLGPLRVEETTIDAYGEVLGTRIVEWSYYDSGEVDEITIDDGNERLIVKHTLDGKQPTATKESIEAEPIER